MTQRTKQPVVPLGAGLAPEQFVRFIVEPALSWLHERDNTAPTEAVRLFLVAVAVQESGLRRRRQWPTGPGRSWWQFEPRTVGAMLAHPDARETMADLLAEFALPRGEDELHEVLAYNDLAACVAARLLLRCDPQPVPVGPDQAWSCYDRVWRPGKPAPERWFASWRAALRGVAWRDPIAGLGRVTTP